MNDLRLTTKLAMIMSAFLVVVSACGLPYCIKYPFSDEDVSWTRIYTEGDTLLFINKNNITMLDTLIVNAKTVYDPSNTCIFDLRGCNWVEGDNEYHASATISMAAYHSGVQYKCLYSLEKFSNTASAAFGLSLFGQYTVKDISTNTTFSNCESVFPNYHDIIVINSSNLTPGLSQPVRPIRTIYWSKGSGLVGYRTTDSFYTLKEIIHQEMDEVVDYPNKFATESNGSKWIELFRSLLSIILP